MLRIDPGFEAFAAKYDAGKPQILRAEIAADLETPVSAMLKLSHGRPYSSLLESVEGGAVRGRYSFIAVMPDLIWRYSGTVAEIAHLTPGDADSEANPVFQREDLPPLESLRALMAASRIDMPENMPPLSAGLAGYMSYDFIRLSENIPADNPDTIDIPDAMFIRPMLVAAFDNVDDVMTLIAPVYPAEGTSARAAYDAATARLEGAVRSLEAGLPHGTDTASDAPVHPTPEASVTQEDYFRMVDRAKDYIDAGDIFQVVLSQRFRMPFSLPAMSLYRSLRRLNPSPFLFHLKMDGFALVGSSPEILVRLRDGTVTIRPIAGTRPRGKDKDDDAALARDLLADPKELAEHLMLLDLGRNDVGRVCEPGTVRVTEQMVIENYSHVMHIVSNVEGRISPDKDAMDALIGGFPAGTVSGAPKIRAMEIIDELENEKRSFYAGAIGYLGADGSMDTCIALRTALVKDGEVIVQAGGGVVADSTPLAEYEECHNKARALIRAAEEAVRFATSNEKLAL